MNAKDRDVQAWQPGSSTVPAEGALRFGTIAGRYELVSTRGRGAMGVVYKARDLTLDRWVALKFLPAHYSFDESSRKRFLREARAGAAANHRNVCTIHDIDSTDDGQLFIVMADYEGQTLKQRLERGPLDVCEALAIAAQIADGLVRLHASGVVHRDIKPSNLMLVEGTVKILDFGIATLAGEQQLTIAGSTVLGTAAYMAPEQAKGEEADDRTDIWALGIVLYEMLLGHAPFRGASSDAVLYAIRHEPTPSLRDERPNIPAAVEKLVLKALDKRRHRRFQNAWEFAAELRQHEAIVGTTAKRSTVRGKETSSRPDAPVVRGSRQPRPPRPGISFAG